VTVVCAVVCTFSLDGYHVRMNRGHATSDTGQVPPVFFAESKYVAKPGAILLVFLRKNVVILCRQCAARYFTILFVFLGSFVA